MENKLPFKKVEEIVMNNLSYDERLELSKSITFA